MAEPSDRLPGEFPMPDFGSGARYAGDQRHRWRVLSLDHVARLVMVTDAAMSDALRNPDGLLVTVDGCYVPTRFVVVAEPVD